MSKFYSRFIVWLMLAFTLTACGHESETEGIL